MSNLLPNDDNKPQDSIPKWSYGVIAGGAVVLATTGITTYHYVSKHFRQEKAKEIAKNIENNQLGNITPREIPTLYL